MRNEYVVTIQGENGQQYGGIERMSWLDHGIRFQHAGRELFISYGAAFVVEKFEVADPALTEYANELIDAVIGEPHLQAVPE